MKGLWAIDSNKEDCCYLIECIPAMAVTKTLYYEPTLFVQGEHTNPNQTILISKNFSGNRLNAKYSSGFKSNGTVGS